MAQARRTRKAKAKANPKRGSGQNTKSFLAAFRQGMGFFITGVFTGVLGIVLWQGYQSDAQGDMGSGLKAMMLQSQQQAAIRVAESLAPEPVLVDNAPRIKPQYDFYTVLPEIEEVLPKDTPELPPVASVKNKAVTKVKPKSPGKDVRRLPAGSAYMLQVAAYGQQIDAERLKAKLAFNGMQASIQKVSIENKNYFRVRIGPYSDYGTMTSDDYKLSQLGFKAMRLRISRAG
jgi:cell division protein FtsN